MNSGNFKSEEERRNEAFFHEETSFAERIRRWDEDVLGDSPDAYRATPPKSQQGLFLENMCERFNRLGKAGITSAQFQAETVRKQRNQEVIMKELDAVQFFRELEEGLKTTEITRKEKPGLIEKLWRWIKMNRFVDVEEYQENARKYHELQARINRLNGNIETLRSQLETSQDVDLLAAKGTSKEAQARQEITRQQTEVQHLINEVTELKKEQAKAQELRLKVWNNVERELNEEAQKLKKSFGNRVGLLINRRQELISQFADLNNDSNESIKQKYQLQQEINKIDIELENLKKEIIKYKADRPIFLFERIFGVMSIPEIYRYGQESSDTLLNTWAANASLPNPEASGTPPETPIPPAPPAPPTPPPVSPPAAPSAESAPTIISPEETSSIHPTALIPTSTSQKKPTPPILTTPTPVETNKLPITKESKEPIKIEPKDIDGEIPQENFSSEAIEKPRIIKCYQFKHGKLVQYQNGPIFNGFEYTPTGLSSEIHDDALSSYRFMLKYKDDLSNNEDNPWKNGGGEIAKDIIEINGKQYFVVSKHALHWEGGEVNRGRQFYEMHALYIPTENWSVAVIPQLTNILNAQSLTKENFSMEPIEIKTDILDEPLPEKWLDKYSKDLILNIATGNMINIIDYDVSQKDFLQKLFYCSICLPEKFARQISFGTGCLSKVGTRVRHGAGYGKTRVEKHDNTWHGRKPEDKEFGEKYLNFVKETIKGCKTPREVIKAINSNLSNDLKVELEQRFKVKNVSSILPASEAPTSPAPEKKKDIDSVTSNNAELFDEINKKSKGLIMTYDPANGYYTINYGISVDEEIKMIDDEGHFEKQEELRIQPNTKSNLNDYLLTYHVRASSYEFKSIGIQARGEHFIMKLKIPEIIAKKLINAFKNDPKLIRRLAISKVEKHLKEESKDVDINAVWPLGRIFQLRDKQNKKIITDFKS